VLDHTIWELRTWQVSGIIALVLLQGLLIVSLLLSRARRLRAQHALRTSDARNTALLRALPDMMFVQRSDGVYLDYHSRNPANLLVPPEQFLGRSMREVLPPDLSAAFEEPMARANASGGPEILEYALPIQNEERHFEARVVSCEPDQLLTIVRDITERKSVERALRESQARYALATSAGRVGVWEWDVETAAVYIDPQIERLLGHSPDEFPDPDEFWRRCLLEEDVEMLSSRMKDYIIGQSPVFEMEHRMVHRDGSIRWFLTRGIMDGRPGGPRRVVGTSTDISERRQAEESLRHTQHEVARLTRLTDMGELAASIAHEVNQPLCAIVANAQASLRWLSADSAGESPNVREALADIVKDANRASEVVKRTRSLFTERPQAKELVDLNEVAQAVITLSQPALQRESVSTRLELEEMLPLAVADRGLLEQVLLNLVMNAIEAMTEVRERSLVIRTQRDREGHLAVAVADTGPGLDAKEEQEVFQAFHTTKSNGMGMGLAISRAIVAAHGGRLWAVGNPEQGATFQFTIPAAQVEESVSAPLRVARASPNRE
jgi:PAS domain S-box-containing protein